MYFMINSKKRKKFLFRTILIAICCLVLIQEWIIYAFYSLKWPRLPTNSGQKYIINFLVVADPQLIGYRNPISGFIERWDSDRYLRKNFQNALEHIKPNIVIFLGDIFDTGMDCTDEEFQAYVHRLKRIFKLDELERVAIIPGDNDIGGDKLMVKPEAVKRFNTLLGPFVFDSLKYKHLEIYNVNVLLKNYSVPKAKNEKIIMAVSHIPLTPMHGTFMQEAVREISPHIVLSAHEHKSIYVAVDKTKNLQINFTYPFCVDTRSMNVISLASDVVHEIVVPTCSYRMGESNMGFGAGLIDSNGTMLYTVLWLPSRYQQLYIYLIAAVISSFIWFAMIGRKRMV